MQAITLQKFNNIFVKSFPTYPTFTKKYIYQKSSLKNQINFNNNKISTQIKNYSSETSIPPSANDKDNQIKFKKLFSPMNIGKIKVKNRIAMAAMGVDVCNPDGTIGDRAINYYRERARNGVGLIITEYTRINEGDGASAVGQMSLSSDRHIKGMTKLVDAIHEEGGKIIVQIQHPGRQTVPIFPTIWPTMERFGRLIPGFWKKYDRTVKKGMKNGINIGGDGDDMVKKQRFLRPNLAPSKMPDNDHSIGLWFVKHRGMTIDEVHRTEQQFINAAIRTKKAGADGVELHATHGYLLQQFLSPFTNRRNDEYGGSFENRCRIIKNLITGIKKKCGPDFPVLIRLTVDEFQDMVGHPERGYHLEDGIRFAKEFEKYGADAIDVSYGSSETFFIISESMRFPLGCRKKYARAIKEAVSIPVISVGLIRSPSQAEEILNEGGQDFIGLGRPLLADSEWASKAMEGREDEISRCITCNRCMESVGTSMLTLDPIDCSLNPRVCRENEIPLLPPKDGKHRKVVVVGAGPAGLVAARELALREFDVEIFEKEKTEGGQILLADKPPFKDRIIWTTQDFRARAEKPGVHFRFGEKATVENIQKLSPEYVIVATGANEIHPNIPGADADYVYTTTPILMGDVKIKDKNVILVGSGLTGLETAELLTTTNNKITIVEMGNSIVPDVGGFHAQEILPVLNMKGVKFITGHKLEEIKDHNVTLSTKDGKKTTLSGDIVVLAVGVKSNNELANELKKKTSIPTYIIGDANKPRRIVDCVKDAFKTARSLH